MVICVTAILLYHIIISYIFITREFQVLYSFKKYKEMKNIECLTLIETETKTNDVAGINKNPDVKCLCLPFIVCFILIT